jgi:hypothetical protein
MGSIIESFNNKLSVLTPFYTFLFMTIVSLVVIFNKNITTWFKSIKWKNVLTFQKRSEEEWKIEDLNSHDIFNVIEEVRNHVKFHKFEDDEVKTKIFRDFIDIMLNEIKSNFKRLIPQVSAMNTRGAKLTRDELKQLVLKTLVITVESYCVKGKKFLIDKGMSEKDAIYVVDLFEKWRIETRESINSRVNSLFASSFYPTNFDRLLAVLELVSVSISLIPKDGVRSFEDMNGKFKNLIY